MEFDVRDENNSSKEHTIVFANNSKVFDDEDEEVLYQITTGDCDDAVYIESCEDVVRLRIGDIDNFIAALKKVQELLK
jgi:hypothetical protein